MIQVEICCLQPKESQFTNILIDGTLFKNMIPCQQASSGEKNQL
jgi:hypothetical protein